MVVSFNSSDELRRRNVFYFVQKRLPLPYKNAKEIPLNFLICTLKVGELREGVTFVHQSDCSKVNQLGCAKNRPVLSVF